VVAQPAASTAIASNATMDRKTFDDMVVSLDGGN
jgi:hypothetical protein